MPARPAFGQCAQLDPVVHEGDMDFIAPGDTFDDEDSPDLMTESPPVFLAFPVRMQRVFDESHGAVLQKVGPAQPSVE